MLLQVATEPVTKTIEGCVLAATLAEGGITRAMKVMLTHSTCSAHILHLLSFEVVPNACTHATEHQQPAQLLILVRS